LLNLNCFIYHYINKYLNFLLFNLQILTKTPKKYLKDKELICFGFFEKK